MKKRDKKRKKEEEKAKKKEEKEKEKALKKEEKEEIKKLQKPVEEDLDPVHYFDNRTAWIKSLQKEKIKPYPHKFKATKGIKEFIREYKDT